MLTCQAKWRDNLRCGDPSAFAVYWPSDRGPVLMCARHAEHATKVADAMGFQLPMVDAELWERQQEENRRVADAVDRLTGDEPRLK